MAITKAKDPNEAARQLARAKKLLRRELSFDEGESAPRKLSPLAQKKRALRKKRQKQLLYLAGFLLFCYGFWWLIKPYESSMKYGICKTFIELNVPYPYTIHFSEVIDFADGSVRVWFSHYDSFGDYRLLPVQCYYAPHEKYGLGLSRIVVGRREIDPDIVQHFNHSLPAIFAYPPDLTYPTPLPNDPNDLQFDFDKYRKQIL
ncbi:MAG: hypothetical protein CMH27_08885 [Micavibrio sp.]|nr:hypothetical protein [Micavibrio sp.]